MKKYLTLLIIPLLFFSTGCEEESTVVTDPLSLDSELFGVWCLNLDMTNHCVSFGSNGLWTYFFIYDLEENSLPYYYNEGGYWVNDGYLFLDQNDPFLYNVSGNNLSLYNNSDTPPNGNYILQ